MGVGLSNGSFYTDNSEALASVHTPMTSKELSDAKEIQANETSGDFQSRFYATDASRMPLESSTELTDALKREGGTRVPGNTAKVKQESPIDAWNALTGQGEYEGKRVQLWPERVVRAAWEGLKAPGEAVQGKLPMWAINPETGEVNTSTQAIEKANDLAGLMITGPAPVAAKLADGTLGSFAGVRAIENIEGKYGQVEILKKGSLKDRLSQAQEMEMVEAAHPDDIWQKTGFFRGADGRWRFEIPDSLAKIKEEGLNVVKVKPEDIDSSVPKGWQIIKPGGNTFYGIREAKKNFFGESKPTLLKDILDHPELYKAYPDIANAKIFPIPDGRTNLGFARPETSEIYMANLLPEQFKDVLHHEIQHLIQSKEGFARGGNSLMFRPVGLDEAKAQFEKAKADFRGTNNADYLKYYGVVQAELNGDLNKFGPEYIAIVKEKIKEAKDKGVYNPIKNIITSERLLAEQEAKEYDNYMKLMGEVESRNVEVRRTMDFYDRKFNSPQSTEDTERSKQIRR